METEPLLVNTEATDVRTAGDNDDPETKAEENRTNKWGLLTLNIVTFFYFFALNPMFTTTDQYAQQAISESFNVSKNGSSRAECLAGNSTHYREVQLEIQSKTSKVMIMVNAAGLIPQFLITFLLGPCSDQIGRKIAFILPPIGGCIKAMIFVVISHFKLNYYYLIIGSFIEGIFGAFPLFFTGCIAYLADCTELKDRSLWLCVLDCTIGLSAVITNIAGGYIITGLGFPWMFLSVAVMFALCALLCITTIKESITNREQVEIKIFTTLHVKRTMRIYLKDNGTNRRWKLLVLLAIVFTLNIAFYEVSDASNFILLSHPVCFSPELFGFFIACVYASKIIGGLGLTKINECGVKEGGLLCVSIISYIAYQIVVSWAHHLGTLFLATIIAAGQLLANPLVRSLISPLGSPNEQGALFAAATWLQQLSTLLGNMYQNFLYAATVSIWRGTFLIVNASVHGICLLLTVTLLVLWKREDMNKSREGRDDLGPRYGSVQDTDNHSTRDQLPTI